MKYIICLFFACAIATHSYSQDNPYKIFGYKPKVQFKESKIDVYKVTCSNPNSKIKFLEFDRDNHLIKLLDDKDSVISKIAITDEQLLRWVTVDPLAEKYPSMSPYNYTLNNPIKYIDPTGMEIDLPGEKKAQDAYVKMLHDNTGNNYEIKDNKLTFTGVDKDFTGKKSGTLSDIISKGIGSKDVYSLQLVGANGDDKGVFVDSYEQGKIDVSDYAKLGQASQSLQAAALGHFLNEVQEVPGYGTADAATRDANFNAAHNPSLSVESKIFGEVSGDASVTARQTIQLAAPVNGYQTVTFKYNNANQFNLVQGATATTVAGFVEIGGVKIPSNNVTITPTGELKSVTKVP